MGGGTRGRSPSGGREALSGLGRRRSGRMPSPVRQRPPPDALMSADLAARWQPTAGQYALSTLQGIRVQDGDRAGAIAGSSIGRQKKVRGGTNRAVRRQVSLSTQPPLTLMIEVGATHGDRPTSEYSGGLSDARPVASGMCLARPSGLSAEPAVGEIRATAARQSTPPAWPCNVLMGFCGSLWPRL
jgi:hypothetical protein